MTRIFVQAEIPPELEHAWLQHLRHFDATHPGCHFAVIMDSEVDATIEEIEAKLDVEPELPLRRFFKRRHEP